MAKKPFFWLISKVLQPIVAFGYWFYLIGKRQYQASEFYGRRLTAYLNHQHALRLAILLIVFGVTATSLYASAAPPDEDLGGEQSIISSLTDDFSDDLLVEEASDDTAPAAKDVSYLDDQSVSAEDYYLKGLPSEEEASYGEEESDLSSEALVNAVRNDEVPGGEPVEYQPPTRTAVTEYTVQVGDTPESIARSFGLHTSTVLQVNGLGSRGLIRIGQVLRIPPVDGLVYKVKKGDTVSKIAKTYRTDAAKILDVNGLADGSGLTVGAEIILPGGVAPAAPKPKVTNPAAVVRDDGSIPPPAADRVGSGSLLWPVGCRRISQYYGRSHTGLDIACPIRTPIYAADDGVIIYSGWNSGGYGNMVLIDHGNGMFTRYGHATKLLVSVGDRVSRGDVIALEGSTGRSTGPHLHFEVMRGSVSNRLNPLSFIK
ncbi:MAG: M23 family metallopeptidase [Patescibacteria group bacterium]|nr:M23 family metallopeptidase [Patescibacteria group bacterium]